MRRPVCLALSVVTLLLGAGVAQAQPGPYPLWTFPTPERTGAPAWYKDMVYVMPFQFSEGGTLADMLYAINATTGQQVFAIPFTPLLNNNTGDWKGMAPAVTEVNIAKAGEPVDNRIVVLYGFHGSYTVYAIDGLTGEALWERRTWPPGCGGLYCQITGFSSPVGGVFVVEQPSFLVSLDARNGHVNWNTSVYDGDGNPGSLRSHVAPYNSGSFIWSTRDYVHRVEIATGGYLWSSQYVEPHCDGFSCAVTSYDPPVVVGDTVYVSGYFISATNGNGGVIMAMSGLTGHVKWSAMPSNFSGWVGANRNIAVMEDGENDSAPINGLYSYNSTTGKLLWHTNWNTTTYASAVMVDPKSNNVAFTLSDESPVLYVYDGVTGALVGSMATGIDEQFSFAPHGSSFAASLSQSVGTPGVTPSTLGQGENTIIHTHTAFASLSPPLLRHHRRRPTHTRV